MPTIKDARQALDTARANLSNGDVRAAGNRAYYAIFYAAGATLAARTTLDPASIKTHSGLWRMFDLHLVKTGLFPRNVARHQSDVQQTRWAADYTDALPADADVSEAIIEAETFVARCEALLTDLDP